MIVLLHISDLHIGDNPQGIGSQRQLPRNFHLVPGHNAAVASALSREWENILLASPSPASTRIVVTGDLTRQGIGYDFGCTHRFIHSYWPATGSQVSDIGLSAGGDRALTIPGNHDFWGGPTLWSFYRVRNPNFVLSAHFWPLPWVYPIYGYDTPGLEVHLIGLNSCSGLSTISFDQAIAYGAIDSTHLTEAEIRLRNAASEARARRNEVVRVVLVHHPPERLTTQSKQEFEKWLHDNRVHVILTGHMHRSAFPLLHQASPHELRCGTTLQAGQENHFYLHTIQPVGPYSTSGDFRWETREWIHPRRAPGWIDQGVKWRWESTF